MTEWWNKCSPSGLKEEICLTKALRLHIKGVLVSEKVRFAVKNYTRLQRCALLCSHMTSFVGHLPFTVPALLLSGLCLKVYVKIYCRQQKLFKCPKKQGVFLKFQVLESISLGQRSLGLKSSHINIYKPCFQGSHPFFDIMDLQPLLTKESLNLKESLKEFF